METTEILLRVFLCQCLAQVLLVYIRILKKRGHFSFDLTFSVVSDIRDSNALHGAGPNPLTYHAAASKPGTLPNSQDCHSGIEH